MHPERVPSHITAPPPGPVRGHPAARKPTWRRVAVPTEHGGWSLTGEPVLLGLLVAWSTAGLALGVATMLAFLARTPLKTVMVDRRRGRWHRRTTLAARIAAVEVALATACLAVTAGGATDPRWWVPLAAAAPLISVQLWHDAQSRSRRLLPEVAGAVGVSAVAAAIALAGGAPWPVAVGLWVVLAARVIGAMPFARGEVMRGRGMPAPRWQSDTAQAAAVTVAATAWSASVASLASAVTVTLLAGAHLWAARRPPQPVKRVGLTQVGAGLLLVAVTAASAPHAVGPGVHGSASPRPPLNTPS